MRSNLRLLVSILIGLALLSGIAGAQKPGGTPPPPMPVPRVVPQFEPGKLWLSIVDESARPPVNPPSAARDQAATPLSGNPRLERIFQSFQVRSFTQVMPFARTPALRDVYEVT